MIAVFPPQDESSKACAESNEYLEQQVEAIGLLDSSRAPNEQYNDVQSGIGGFKQATEVMTRKAWEKGRLVLQLKTNLKPKAYRAALEQADIPIAEANKYLRFFKTFERFQIPQVVGIGFNTLLSLCTKAYSGVVEKLLAVEKITHSLIERLKKESRLHRSSSQQSTPITGWKRNSSGGGRQYVVRLVNEQVGIIVEKQAQAQGLLPHRVVEYTILRAQENQVVHPGDYTLAQMQELHETIEQMRSVQIEKERLEFKLRQMEVEKQAEITALQEKVQQLESRLAAAPEPPPSDPFVAPTEPPLIEQKDSDPLQQTKTWSEVAQITQCQGDSLLKAVKTWQIEEQKHLVNLLVAHLESVPEALDEAKWIPQKLLTKALSKLSYTICKIGGPNNLVDEPELEYISGCSLANLQNFGTRREQWIFEDSNNRRYPVFGRDAFAIEKFSRTNCDLA